MLLLSKPLGGHVGVTDTAVDLATLLNAQRDEDQGREGPGAEVLDNLMHSLVFRAETSNAGNVFIGGSLVDGDADTWMKLEPGDGVGFDLAVGDYLDLRNVYVITDDVAGSTSTDSIYVFGVQ